MKKFVDSYQGPQGSLPGNLPEESFHRKIDGLEFDVSYPEVRLRMIDEALIDWFDKQHPITVKLDNKSSYRVPAIWAASDRFSMLNSEKHLRLRDEHGTLLLPIISVRRSQTELVPERTAAVDKGGVTEFQLYVREYIDPVTMEKRYMTDQSEKGINSALPIRQIISINSPKIVRLTYDINCWSKKQRHSNEMLENVIVNFGQHSAIFVNQNLFFGAWLQSMDETGNAENLNSDERIFNTSCTVIVEASIITEDSIRVRRTVEKITVSVENSENTISKTESDRIRDSLLWDNPYRLHRP